MAKPSWWHQVHYGRWYRWPSYLWLALTANWSSDFDMKGRRTLFPCPCVNGCNDYYWNGWFKRPKGCDCGG